MGLLQRLKSTLFDREDERAQEPDGGTTLPPTAVDQIEPFTEEEFRRLRPKIGVPAHVAFDIHHEDAQPFDYTTEHVFGRFRVEQAREDGRYLCHIFHGRDLKARFSGLIMHSDLVISVDNERVKVVKNRFSEHYDLERKTL